MTHITEEQLVAFALDDVETATRAAVAAHVEACAVCRASLDEIRATLDAAAALDVPERGDDYGARVWTSIEPRLGTVAAPRHTRVMPWLAAAAAVLLVTGAYWLGRHNAVTGGGSPVTTTASAPSLGTDAIRERVVLAALGEHFDRTERTLVELVNTRSGGRVDISAEQAWARDLLDANRLYRQATGGANSPPLGAIEAPPVHREAALSQVLEDLEPVLLEIANSPSQLTSDEFETLRDRIEARSLVFKVRVTGADVRARERALILRQAQDDPSRSTVRPGSPSTLSVPNGSMGIRRGESLS